MQQKSEIEPKKSEAELISSKAKVRAQFLLKPYYSIILVIISCILFTVTGAWQLIVIAGAIGGFFSKRAKLGGIIGFLGTFLGWMTLFFYYVLTTEMLIFFRFWIEETMGYSIETVYLLMVICSIFGGFISGLGGINGVYLREILINQIIKKYF